MRLGIILIGLGLLLWGLHVQNKYEGFQSITAPSAPAAAPVIAAAVAPVIAPAGTPVGTPAVTLDDYSFDFSKIRTYQIDAFRNKVLEIQLKYDLVDKIKLTADIKLTKLLSDTDTMAKINILYSEVKSFLNGYEMINIDKIFSQNESDLKDESLKNAKNTLSQLVFTAYDQMAVLYRIYYTIPSLIISSGVVISTDTATVMSVIDDNVIAKSIGQISMEVASIPSANEQLTSITDMLMKSAMDLQKDYSDTTLGIFQQLFTRFLSIVDIEISNLDVKLANLENTNMNTKMTNVLNTKIMTLTGIIKSLKALHDTLTKIPNLNVGISSNIKTNITSYETILTDTKAKYSPKEGFQSHGNSYNMPSPNIKQAYEFRLDKKQYIDNVFSSIKFFTA